jgi:hypothetical protein
MAPSRVLRADDHLPLRTEVRISSEAAVSLAAAVSSGRDAIQKFRECVSEIALPDKSGATDCGVKYSASHCLRVAFHVRFLLPAECNQAARVESCGNAFAISDGSYGLRQF